MVSSRVQAFTRSATREFRKGMSDGSHWIARGRAARLSVGHRVERSSEMPCQSILVSMTVVSGPGWTALRDELAEELQGCDAERMICRPLEAVHNYSHTSMTWFVTTTCTLPFTTLRTPSDPASPKIRTTLPLYKQNRNSPSSSHTSPHAPSSDSHGTASPPHADACTPCVPCWGSCPGSSARSSRRSSGCRNP